MCVISEIGDLQCRLSLASFAPTSEAACKLTNPTQNSSSVDSEFYPNSARNCVCVCVFVCDVCVDCDAD